MTSARGGGSPQVNTLVMVTVPGLQRDLPSRVEDVRGDRVVIAAPDVGGRARVRAGEVLTLAWTAPPRGLLATSCLLDDVEPAVPLLWVLRPVGALRRLQRRRFARADVSARVSLSGTERSTAPAMSTTAPVSPTAGWVATGFLSDLSEGGARVLLDSGHRVPSVAGEELSLDLRISGGRLVTPATVVGDLGMVSARQQVRVRFDLTETDSARVRRAVMQRQVESRTREGGS